MPEGHTIHRYARLHRTAFAGQSVRAWSPQGRFVEGAARLDGSTLVDVEAYGKHLWYRFEPAGLLHVHLGLFGRFRSFDGDAPEPTAGTRLALVAQDGTTLHLAGAVAVELVDDDARAAVVERLGPDPLSPDADPERFTAALARRRVGIGHALLDQTVLAGIGNVYRSELLFLHGIHPDVPAREVPDDAVTALWEEAVRQLRAGERTGRIVTVRPQDRSRPPSRLRADERVYVYRRAGEPCHRCGSAVVAWQLAGRRVFACLTDQPREGPGNDPRHREGRTPAGTTTQEAT